MVIKKKSVNESFAKNLNNSMFHNIYEIIVYENLLFESSHQFWCRLVLEDHHDIFYKKFNLGWMQ